MLLFIHWNIDPNIPLPFHFFSIQWYGLMWTLSIFGSFFLGRWILAKENIGEDHLVLIIQYMFIGSIIGARLGQVFFYDFALFRAHPLEIFEVWKGGLASHGGVIGGLIAIYLFHRAHREYSLTWLLDHIALVMYLPCSLIRLGNLFNSELPGRPTDVPWAFIFGRGRLMDFDLLPRHPVVLYESISYFLLLIVVITLYRRWGNSRPGIYVAFFFTFTFLTRFLLEFMKEPEGHLYFGLVSKTQLLSLPMIALGLIFFIFTYRNKGNIADQKSVNSY
jgi:phosphatidylglycerol:prolipoprotein diacylglycerol transferase